MDELKGCIHFSNVIIVVVVLLLLWVAYSDWKSYRISNIACLIFFIIDVRLFLVELFPSALEDFEQPADVVADHIFGYETWKTKLAVFLLVLAFCLFFYHRKSLGGGDLKLLPVVCTLYNTEEVYILFCSLAVFMSIYVLFEYVNRKRSSPDSKKKTVQKNGKVYLPLGVPLLPAALIPTAMEFIRVNDLQPVLQPAAEKFLSTFTA